MLFDPEALHNKVRYLDAVYAEPGLVERVVGRHVPAPFELAPLPRTWEPGGGASLFRVESAAGPCLLKVKHRDVWIESRLESEPAFHRTPSLANEFEFLRRIEAPWVPRVIFFAREGAYDLLALEWLEPFASAAPRLTVPRLLRAFEDLGAAAAELFRRGMVHTDIHEHNLCFRGEQVVLIDFEEARKLLQDVPFEQSLDFAGSNRYGDLGQFPVVGGGEPGRTCLSRLRRVFEGLVRARLPESVAKCRFGPDCPYNLDALQEPDARAYQSLSLGGFTIEGHRPLDDRRLRLVELLVRRLGRRIGPVTHLDIGCNFGAFCFRTARSTNVQRVIGVDAAQEYIDVARALAFLERVDNVEFRRLVVGQDSLLAAFPGVNLVTLFSVYHHVPDRDALLADLRALAPRVLIAEFATQDRFYPERGTLAAEISHVQQTLGFPVATTVATSSDYRRPVVVFSTEPLDRRTVLWSRLAAERPARLARRLVPLPLRRGLRRAVDGARQRLRRRPAAPGPVRALEWLRANELPNGGIRVHSGHRAAYAEVSGYLVPTLLGYGEQEFARRVARWLVRVQGADGSFVDPDHGRPYVFDTGQALRGLLSALPFLPEAEPAARRAADYLCRRMLGGGRGGFPRAYQEPYVSESIHLYCVPPLIEAAERLGVAGYSEAAGLCLEHYLGSERLLDDRASLTHFLAYELEALLDLGRADLAAPALARLAGASRPDGAVRALGGARWVCTPGLLQLAVCWYKTGCADAADRAVAWVEARQGASGGFRGSFGRGAWYFPREEPAWAVKYYLDAHLLRLVAHFERHAAEFPDAIDPGDGRVRLILSAVREGDRVLDVGCGKGRFLKALRAERAALRCTGVDISPAQLRHVPEDIETRVGSLEAIPCADEAYDVVFSVEALEHSPNPPAAIRELARVARPGGQVVIVDKELAHWGRLKSARWESWPEEDFVRRLLAEQCEGVTSEAVGYDDNPPDGLMVAWRGLKRPSVRR